MTRLAIDELRSARARREPYVGEWLPEPLVRRRGRARPATRRRPTRCRSRSWWCWSACRPSSARRSCCATSSTTPTATIAEIIGTSEANARQIATRARRRSRRAGRATRRHGAARRARERFLAAAEEGDLAGARVLLAEDVELHGDGGGNAPALARPLHGPRRVARTLLAWARAARRFGGATCARWRSTASPARSLDGEGRLPRVALDIADDRVQALRSVVNPDKLGHLGPLIDYAALIKRRS